LKTNHLRLTAIAAALLVSTAIPAFADESPQEGMRLAATETLAPYQETQTTQPIVLAATEAPMVLAAAGTPSSSGAGSSDSGWTPGRVICNVDLAVVGGGIAHALFWAKHAHTALTVAGAAAGGYAGLSICK
jgi:hypothetical protein